MDTNFTLFLYFPFVFLFYLCLLRKALNCIRPIVYFEFLTIEVPFTKKDKQPACIKNIKPSDFTN
jgi:hypothetical protein